MRLGALVLAGCVAACGGGKSEPKNSGPVGLTAGEGCIKEANVSQQPPDDAPEHIDVLQIIVKHDAVKGAVAQNITRSREDACLRATEARSVVISQDDWDATHDEYSDEKGPTKGAIQNLARDFNDPFSNAAFSLDVNEVSYVVESKRGFHVIVRTR